MWKDDLPREFPKGSELTNRLVNAIIRELWRWRKVQVAPPLAIDYAESDQPPMFSVGPQPYTFAWGVTPSGGYSSGTISSPTSNSTAMTLYPIPGNTATTISISKSYSTYANTVAASKTALYQLFPDNNWYVITADC